MFSAIITLAYISSIISVGILVLFYFSVLFSAIFKRKKDVVDSSQFYGYVKISRRSSIILLISALLSSFTGSQGMTDIAIRSIIKFLSVFGIIWTCVFFLSIIIKTVLSYVNSSNDSFATKAKCNQLTPYNGKKSNDSFAPQPNEKQPKLTHPLGNKCYVSLIYGIVFFVSVILIRV